MARRILAGFGHNLPIAPATRIWSTSELARYIPGVIWQVAGRVYLVRPYGVRSGVCSTSQILELILFLLANVLVATTCLLWNGFKHLHGPARTWLIAAMLLVPVLMLLLHPRIFYGTADRTLRPAQAADHAAAGAGCTCGAVDLVGCRAALAESGHLYGRAPPLGLEPTKWWVIAGAYCLAYEWPDFLAFWAPVMDGELVFVAAMGFMLPQVRETFLRSGGTCRIFGVQCAAAALGHRGGN